MVSKALLSQEYTDCLWQLASLLSESVIVSLIVDSFIQSSKTMFWYEWALQVFLLGLFCYLRALKPWTRKEDHLDPLLHDKPLRPLMISEKVILANVLFIVPLNVYVIDTFGSASKTLVSESGMSVVEKYFFGLLLSVCVNQVIKLVTCRPRPNAIALESLAQDGKKPEWFKCDPSLESRQSFFSGHALLGSFCSFFIVFLIQEVSQPKRSLAPSAVQFLLILLGMFPAMSQGVSYWHHWDDVIVGYGVGILAAAATYYGIAWW